jgi:mutator protein MutT
MHSDGSRLPVIHVVAGVVTDATGRILIAQRPAGKRLAGGWEFPGGKLEPGEARAAGLARELHEEIGITIRSPRPLLRAWHTYPYGDVMLDMWVVSRYHGEPRGVDGQALRWCRQDELEDERATADLLPADRPIVRALRLPETLVQRSTPYYTIGVVEAAAAIAGAGDTRLRGAFCSSAAEAEVLGGIGVWAEADRERGTETGGGLGASAGTGAESRGGGGAPVDFLVLRTVLCPEDLAALCRRVAVPVYARELELEAVWALGATGVSLI